MPIDPELASFIYRNGTPVEFHCMKDGCNERVFEVLNRNETLTEVCENGHVQAHHEIL